MHKVKSLSAVCRDFNISLPAAALQFPLGHDTVASVIPGLRNRKELSETLHWSTEVIPGDFWKVLKDKDLLHPNASTPDSSPFSANVSENLRI